MAKQTINLGTAPSGAGGDDQRGAFTKTNSNFTELYDAFGGTIPANSAAKAALVGPVSSGAVMESGSTATGWWFKYQNGMMICVTWFTGYTGGVVKTAVWPQPFTSKVMVSYNIVPGTAYDSTVTVYGSQTTATFYSTITAPQNEVNLMAIGWWK